MILYHGSNMTVEKPCLMPMRRMLDFGAAFYLTSDLEQARKWATHTATMRGEGGATVSVYEFDSAVQPALNILRFEAPDRDWLRFVSANRTGKPVDDRYDIIIGPVANDQAIRTVNDYLNGYFPEDIAIRLLLPQKLKDQYAFKTEAALSRLRFKEALR